MTTKVEKSIQVNVPISTVYNQWTQFEDFPQFMGGVQKVEQLGDRRLRWTAEIGGVKREWEASILEQVPDQKIAWAATEGATNAGAVTFTPVGTGTMVNLTLEYEPEGMVETIGDKLSIIEKRAEADLEKFKSFIESRGQATGAWRGGVNEEMSVGTPGVEAASSQGDSGKSGISGKAVAAGAALAAAGAAAAAAMSGSSEDESAPVKSGTARSTGQAPMPESTGTQMGTTSGTAESIDVRSAESSTTATSDSTPTSSDMITGTSSDIDDGSATSDGDTASQPADTVVLPEETADATTSGTAGEAGNRSSGTTTERGL